MTNNPYQFVSSHTPGEPDLTTSSMDPSHSPAHLADVLATNRQSSLVSLHQLDLAARCLKQNGLP